MRNTLLICLGSVVLSTIWGLARAVGSAQADTRTLQRLTFLLQSPTDPIDPDPTRQTPEQRKAILRSRIKSAITLIEAKKGREFVNAYLDPFWLARNAASEKCTIEELVNRMVKGKMHERFLKVLRRSLEAEPSWLLDGRVASFMEKPHNSTTAEFWVYFDGKWRISPET